jgi:hypothetical protein
MDLDIQSYNPEIKKFVCVPEAENEANNWASKLYSHDLKDIKIVLITEKAE